MANDNETLAVGDMAAMREALEAARDLLLPQCNGGTAFAKACGETVNKIMDALSAPPRNCDVGSEEEQSRRYEAFCEAHHMQCDKGCSACPCSKKRGTSCDLAWAQMSYEAQEGAGK